MPLPDTVDEQKLAEAALAILGLTAHRFHTQTRVWKGMDWDLLAVLHERGWIEDPVGKAKSVALTEEGERLFDDLLERHFGRSPKA
jgi:Domain of unknown function (DUF6429)